MKEKNIIENLTFEQRIDEFLNELNLLKFFHYSNLTFSDETLMGSWFFYNGKTLLNSNTTKCMKIKKQLLEFLNMCDEIVEVFALDEKNKTLITTYELKQIYSVNKGHIDISVINKSFNDLYIEYNLNNSRDISYLLMVFLKRKCKEKFEQNSGVNFSNGLSMGVWFNQNKDYIFSLNNELSKLVMRQYENYKCNKYIDLDYIDLTKKGYSYFAK